MPQPGHLRATRLHPVAQFPGLREIAQELRATASAFGVGFVLGPAIGGLAALGGPHVPFYVAGVLATVNALAALIRLPETRRSTPTAHTRVHVPRSSSRISTDPR